MSINRIFQCGFETGTQNEMQPVPPSIGTSAPKTGSYSIQALSNPQYFICVQGLGTGSYQMRGGFYINHGPGGSNPAGKFIIRFRNSSGGAIVGLRENAAGSALVIWANGADRASTTITLPVNQYYHLGFDFKIDTSGWFNVYFDGSLAGSWNGNTGSSPIVDFLFGPNSSSGSDSIGAIYADDFYIDDTTGESVPNVPPLLRFPWVSPNGNGNYSQWLGSDLDQTDNYLLVDERPPSTADYVTASGVDLFDSYTMSNYTLGTNEIINAFIPIVNTSRQSSTEKLALGSRYSSTDVIASGVDINTSYSFISERQTTKPGGGSWDQISIDGVELVIKSEGTY